MSTVTLSFRPTRSTDAESTHSFKRARCLKDCLAVLRRTRKPGESMQSLFQEAIDELLTTGRVADCERLYSTYSFAADSFRVSTAAALPTTTDAETAERLPEDVEGPESDWRELRALPVPARIRRPTYAGIGGAQRVPTLDFPNGKTDARVAENIRVATALATRLWDSIPDCPISGPCRSIRFRRIRILREYVAQLSKVDESAIAPPRKLVAVLVAPLRADHIVGPTAKQVANRSSARMAAIRPSTPRARTYANNAARQAAYRARKALKG